MFSYLTQKINSSTYYKCGNCRTKDSKQGDGTNILKEVTLLEKAEMRGLIREADPVGEDTHPRLALCFSAKGTATYLVWLETWVSSLTPMPNTEPGAMTSRRWGSCTSRHHLCPGLRH